MDNKNNYNKIDIVKKLKNAEGKRMLTKIILEYSKEIITILEKNPEILIQVLDELELTEDDFLAYLSGDKKGNITLYDQTLCLVKNKTNNTIKINNINNNKMIK